MSLSERHAQLLKALATSIKGASDGTTGAHLSVEAWPEQVKADLLEIADAVQPQPSRPTAPTGKWSPETRARIVEDVRRGAYLQQAAKAAGVAISTLKKWRNDKRAEYVAFQHELDQAIAQVRVVQEHRVYTKDPLTWLKFVARDNGPDDPGWTETTRIKVEQESQFDVASLEVKVTCSCGKPIPPPDILRGYLDAIRAKQATTATVGDSASS